MTDAEYEYDRLLYREAQYPRGHVAELIEFHLDMAHVDPVIIFDREEEHHDGLE